MSFDKNKDRRERSFHLTIKQYNIIVSFLNTGIKPTIRVLEEADLVENLNGGVSKSGRFHRLKSLASRLSLRPTDGALIYATNGKVVLPSNKFVQTIRQAHRGTGEKHLNCSRTLAKLQETYTIGRRQFGICEEQIRDVVKSCNQGSCRKSKRRRNSNSDIGTPAKNAKLDGEDEPQETKKDTGNQVLKSLLAVNVHQSPLQGRYTNFIPTQSAKVLPQIASNESVGPVENAPMGSSNKNCIFVVNPTLVLPSTSLTDLKSFINPQITNISNAPQLNPSGSQKTSYMYIVPTTQAAGTQFQVQAATNNSQPNLRSNLMCVQNAVPLAPNSQAGVRFVCNPIFGIPILNTPETITQTENSINSSDVSSVINSFSNSVDENNNFRAPSCSVSTLLDADDIAPLRCTDENEDDVTVIGTNDKPATTDAEDFLAAEIDTNSAKDVDQVPFPNLWHYFKDFSYEKNPYQKIYIGIQDMKLDLMKSMVGDLAATERLKKKINYLDYLVKVQKNATEPYKLDALET